MRVHVNGKDAMTDPLDRVQFGGGLREEDRPLVATTLSQLLTRLASVPREWQMELSVKDREAPGQVTTLEAWIPGKQRLVATSREAELRDALNDVGADLLRQYDKARGQRTNYRKGEAARG